MFPVAFLYTIKLIPGPENHPNYSLLKLINCIAIIAIHQFSDCCSLDGFQSSV